MKNHAFAARSGRGVAMAVTIGLLSAIAQPARSQAADAPGDAAWASEHIDLDLLPVAYVVRARHLTVGGPVNMTPVGFPSSKYVLYPNLTYGLTARTEAMLGVTGAERLGPGGEAIFYTLGLQQVLLSSTETARRSRSVVWVRRTARRPERRRDLPGRLAAV